VLGVFGGCGVEMYFAVFIYCFGMCINN